MTSRRLVPGWQSSVGGLSLRVVPGKKVDALGRRTTDTGEPIDYRLEMRCDGRWLPVPMAIGAIFADFFYQNEDALYPRSLGYQGGEKYRRYLGVAVRHGFATAEAWLQQEKAQKTLFQGSA